ncbi:S-methyl-5-thioribose-1-phosphate isomerase [Candidatus Altiarchaeota archaeon]
MKVLIDGVRKDFRPVWMDGKIVKLIDQRRIPHEFKILDCKNHMETAGAIRDMVVRGAPAIGATAAYGLAQATFEVGKQGSSFFLKKAKETLASARPTAYDLFHALNYVGGRIEGKEGIEETQQTAVDAANQYADESAERCRMIGVHGEKLITDGMKLLTHCNAGALACVDYGTALAPMRVAHDKGKNIFVFADETKPRGQGARLTAWEMVQEGIDHAVIADNAAGYYMQRGEIDLVIVGTDRVAANGDIANKIGTYEKAVLAKENGIPFYVAAPSSTIDLSCPSGNDIVIEERGEDEVHYTWGFNETGKFIKVRTTPKDAKARNPAFDVTPARYVTEIITEKGLFKPERIADSL